MSAAMLAAVQGDLSRFMQTEAAIVEKASRAGTKATTEEIKAVIRRRVAQALTGGKRGKNVAKSIRSQIYHDGPGKDAGLVWSRFGRGKGAQFVDYLLPHVKGALIKPRNSKFLLIPQTETRGKATKYKRVAFIPYKGGLLMINPRKGNSFVVLAILVKQVRMKARIYLDDMPQFALRRLTEEVLEEMAVQR